MMIIKETKVDMSCLVHPLWSKRDEEMSMVMTTSAEIH